MAEAIRQFDYHYVITGGDPGIAAGIIRALCGMGIDLLAFSSFPSGDQQTQLNLVADDAGALLRVLEGMGLKVSARKSGFLIHADAGPCAVTEALSRLSEARIPVVSVQAISTGALLWVKQEDVQRAAETLDASGKDKVDEASEESFPASDAPAWVF